MGAPGSMVIMGAPGSMVIVPEPPITFADDWFSASHHEAKP